MHWAVRIGRLSNHGTPLAIVTYNCCNLEDSVNPLTVSIASRRKASPRKSLVFCTSFPLTVLITPTVPDPRPQAFLCPYTITPHKDQICPLLNAQSDPYSFMSTLSTSTATKWPTRLLRRPGHSSPAVRALGIDEIIRYILCFIPERRDLHALLFVCKSLHVPALDRLWEVIPNLSPLFGILPKDAIDFMVEKNCEGKLVYVREFYRSTLRLPP